MLVKNILSFLSSENIFIFLSFLRVFPLRYRILGLQFLFCQHSKNIFTSSWPPQFLIRNLLSFGLFSSYRKDAMCLFPLKYQKGEKVKTSVPSPNQS